MKTAKIPERLFRILRSCEDQSTSHFPATEVFNEGWMLRLVLDAMQTLNARSHALRFLSGSRWYSEARLGSPFRPRIRKDPLGEGSTNADGVIGHFEMRRSSKAGIELKPDGRQFVVVEAKMFSNLSSRTTYAPGYNQAARNVACMAEALAQSRIPLADFESVGFVLIAPELDKRCHRDSNLETCLTADSIRSAVDQRIAAYEAQSRREAPKLREWERNHFLPLVSRLEEEKSLEVLSWEQLIDAVKAANRECGDELFEFYQQCLTFAPIIKPVS